MMAGYEAEVDFHSTDPNELAKLQKYNDRDSVSTLVIAQLIWERLEPSQRIAAEIEAECLPMVAEANLHGMPIDKIVSHELAAWLQHTAKQKLEQLAPHGVNEAVVRSPNQDGEAAVR
jgi:hypothetical protein